MLKIFLGAALCASAAFVGNGSRPQAQNNAAQKLLARQQKMLDLKVDNEVEESKQKLFARLPRQEKMQDLKGDNEVDDFQSFESSDSDDDFCWKLMEQPKGTKSKAASPQNKMSSTRRLPQIIPETRPKEAFFHLIHPESSGWTFLDGQSRTRPTNVRMPPFNWHVIDVPGETNRIHGMQSPLMDGETGQTWAERLLANGVGAVVNLEESSYSEKYSTYGDTGGPELLEALTQAGIHVYHVPVEDFEAPASSQFREMDQIVTQTFAKGRDVLFHCFGGNGRTGTAVAGVMTLHILRLYKAKGIKVNVDQLARDILDGTRHYNRRYVEASEQIASLKALLQEALEAYKEPDTDASSIVEPEVTRRSRLTQVKNFIGKLMNTSVTRFN